MPKAGKTVNLPGMSNPVTDFDRQMEAFQADFKRVHKEISKIIVGYSDLIDDILANRDADRR